MAGGPAHAEALANAQAAINEWIESAQELNRHIPVPRRRLTYA